MENHRSFFRDGGCLDNDPHCGVELCCAAIGGPPRAIERGGHHDRIAFLGLGLGRHGTGAGDSHHGCAASDLRSHGIVEAHWALAERLKPLCVWWTSIVISSDSNASLEPIPWGKSNESENYFADQRTLVAGFGNSFRQGLGLQGSSDGSFDRRKTPHARSAADGAEDPRR